MASGVVELSDVIIPALFAPYVQQLTEEKSRLVQSAAISRDTILDSNLAGAGLTFNEPSFKDLENDADNVATDNPATLSTPNKIQTAQEIQVRLSRNNSWSSMDLAGDLIGIDPMHAIASRVAAYWVRRYQAAFVATMKGVFANDIKGSPGGTAVQNDLLHDISGSSFADGSTNFSTEAFIDTTLTMGDSMEDLALVMVHSIVYGRMLKNNLIDFIPDSDNPSAKGIPTFLGRTLVVDDGVPFNGAVFETWLFGVGAIRWGVGSPKVPVETIRIPAAGNGSGQETLHNRVELCIHPVGHAYSGTAPKGGPDNTNSANMLANDASFLRVFTERKQIKIARLLTREF